MDRNQSHIDWDKLLEGLEKDQSQGKSLSPQEQELLAELRTIKAEAYDLLEDYRDFNTANELLQVKARIYLHANLPNKKLIKIWPRIGIAAAVSTIIIGAGLFYFSGQSIKTGESVTYTNDVAPGTNKAILTLANGKTISLSDVKSGIVIKASELTYSDGTSIETIKTKGDEISTISTPRGGQYNIELTDGTIVALNAASTLKFPSTFLGLVNRTVELAGEGYFQVAKDKKHPFIVKSAGQQVEVLGTHFNVTSYADEPTTETTLLEGSIKVSLFSSVEKKTSNRKVDEKILEPGEQSQLSRDGDILIAKVNAEEAIAWKNGKFVFNDEPLESIMRKISRWYNVDVIYQKINPKEPFWGNVSRSGNVSKVLEKLELTGDVHFKIEGRKIYVTR